jgi:hypothetical protein
MHGLSHESKDLEHFLRCLVVRPFQRLPARLVDDWQTNTQSFLGREFRSGEVLLAPRYGIYQGLACATATTNGEPGLKVLQWLCTLNLEDNISDAMHRGTADVCVVRRVASWLADQRPWHPLT